MRTCLLCSCSYTIAKFSEEQSKNEGEGVIIKKTEPFKDGEREGVYTEKEILCDRFDPASCSFLFSAWMPGVLFTHSLIARRVCILSLSVNDCASARVCAALRCLPLGPNFRTLSKVPAWLKYILPAGSLVVHERVSESNRQ